MIVGEITSIKDDRVVLLRELNTIQGRRKLNRVAVRGLEALSWAFESGLVVDFIVVHSKIDISDNAWSNAGIPIYCASEGILKKITGTNYLVPIIGCVNVGGLYDQVMSKNRMLVVLEDIYDHGNIGTIFRTALAFGIDTVMTIGDQSDQFYQKSIDASRGAVFSCHYSHVSEAKTSIEQLKKAGYSLVVTSPHGKNLQSLINLKDKNIAVVFGNESQGVSREMLDAADIVIAMPMLGGVESLNVGVAAGLTMYELKLRMILMNLPDIIVQTLGRDMSVISKLTRRILDQKIKQVSDITAQQLIFLMICVCNKIMKRSSIMKDIGLHVSEIDFFLTYLFEKNYIIEQTDGILVTYDGQQAVAALWPYVEQTYAELFLGFTREERTQFLKLLARMKNNAQEQLGNKAIEEMKKE